ncbi:DUF572-domain-containing protein [Testicularia cyperi]|uniref:Splicing factor YJU2 n=1 Tax=Testicularia cyperi TaxID=1882483 RepID=A0A317XM47_9BASI|nr:DUF572-domain-containing protein [Testicularia cyperi]
MADRKALTHYYPPDFDPSKIPRRKLGKDRQQPVRLMAPFSMRCNLCGEYIYKGKKFNARKEQVQGEDYYGIKIYRFYIKCTQCSAEITFKTDPKNADYIAEHGASRNFEPWRDEDADDKGLTEEEKLMKKLESVEGDPMKQLEDKALDSRREMEILDALQDIRTRNAKLERVDTDAVLAKLHSRSDVGTTAAAAAAASIKEAQRALAEEEDEALVQKYFGKAMDVPSSSLASSSAERLPQGDSPDSLGDGGAQSSPTPAGISVKRKFVDPETGDDKEPDIHTLLALRGAPTMSVPASSSSSSSSSAPSSSAKPMSTPAPAKKKKAGPNALGLVRKKK